MNSIIKKISKKLNNIIQYPKLVKATFFKINRGFCKDLLFLKKDLGFNFSAIIDVGAAIGEYSKAAHFIFPESKIIAFEPIPDSFKKLKDVATEVKEMQCFNFALSNEEGEAEFHLNDFSFSSSLLKMTDVHKEIYPFSKNEKTVKVKTTKLDNIITEIDGDVLLKIDVQGAEYNVLKGTVNLLKKIAVVQLEVSFLNFYDGQANIEDIINFLKTFGFNAFLQISPSFSNKKLLYTDFIFWKN